MDLEKGVADLGAGIDKAGVRGIDQVGRPLAGLLALAGAV